MHRAVECCQVLDLQTSFSSHAFTRCNHDKSVPLWHPPVSKTISARWHHVRGASPPAVSYDGWCFFLGYRCIVYKQLMGETMDQHVGFQSNGRQSSNNLHCAWVLPLEAQPESMTHSILFQILK